VAIGIGSDRTWETYGAEDPYFGVLTDPRFHASEMTAQRRAEFFATGTVHVGKVLETIRQRLDHGFQPRRALDFGCGVGRVALPLARVCAHVTGVDISPSMLREAGENARQAGLANIEWLLSDNRLSRVPGRFDLVHSYIVLQHLPRAATESVLRQLLDRVEENGVAAVHLLYQRRESPARALAYWARREVPLVDRMLRLVRGAGAAPRLMQMNPTRLAPLFESLQAGGFGRVYVEFSDHGNAHTSVPGVFVFARRTPGLGW